MDNVKGTKYGKNVFLKQQGSHRNIFAVAYGSEDKGC